MKTTKQFAQEIQDKWSATLVSEYAGAHKDVAFLCENGHENTKTATNLLQRGFTCRTCKNNREVFRVTWNIDTIRTLQDLKNKGHTLEEIAIAMDTTKASVASAIMKFDITSPIAEPKRKQEVIDILTSQNREVIGEFTALKQKISIKCAKGHIVKQNAYNILDTHSNCPRCTTKTVSEGEIQIREFISNSYTGWVEYNDRTILPNNGELDIVIPDLGIAIEYNGCYWHSDAHVKSDYHKNKSDIVEAFGFKLIHINEWVWNNKQEAVKHMLLTVLQPKVVSTNVQEVTQRIAKEYLDIKHICGYANTDYAVMCGDSIVTFNIREEVVYVSRILGNVSSCIKYIINTFNPLCIIAEACRDYYDTELLKDVGFIEHEQYSTRYAFYKKSNKCTAEEVIEKYGTEELAKLDNWYKVYDSGNILYELLLS